MKIRYLEGLIKHKNSEKVALNTISSIKEKNNNLGT